MVQRLHIVGIVSGSKAHVIIKGHGGCGQTEWHCMCCIILTIISHCFFIGLISAVSLAR